MKNHPMIERLLEEVLRGQQPKRVLEQYILGVKQSLQYEQDIIEALMAMYPDLDVFDSSLLDESLERYYEDQNYSLVQLVRDILVKESSQFLNNRVGELIKRFEINLDTSL